MKIFEKDLQINIKNIPDGALLLDIETTGLSIETTHLYLFGCVYQTAPGMWHFKQWLLESPLEECEALKEIISLTEKFKVLVHFNGDRFDLPYLDYHAKACGLYSPFLTMQSFDLFKNLKCLKTLLALPNTKQKSFEAYIDNKREDLYNGGQLIEVYHEYVYSRDEKLLTLLLLHNREDVLGMMSLFRLLPYSTLFNDPQSVLCQDFDAKITDLTGKKELLVTFELGDEYPFETSIMISDYYLAIRQGKLYVRLPLYQGKLKYFFPHPREYYYLPDEDIVIHKSVASFVDRSHLEKVKPERCYAEQEGTYAMLINSHGQKVFRTEPTGRPYIPYEQLSESREIICELLQDIFGIARKMNHSTNKSI